MDLERMEREHVDRDGFCPACTPGGSYFGVSFPCDAAIALSRVRELEGALVQYGDEDSWGICSPEKYPQYWQWTGDDEKPWTVARAVLAGEA